MKILVTGASGLLGKKVFSLLKRKHDVTGTCFNSKKAQHLTKLDLTDLVGIDNFLDHQKPEAVIHIAAITDINTSEQHPYLAKLVNADAAIAIARWCKRNAAQMVYISSDYVFDGEHGPYEEDSEPAPVQIYGFTKLLGEAVMKESSEAAVVRVAILHGFNDFDDKPVVTTEVVEALKAGSKLTLDSGRLKYPTLIDDVAEGLGVIVKNKLSGIFHLAGSEGVTRYEWALRIARLFNLDESLLTADPDKDSKALPRRPKNVKLLNKRLNFQLHDLDESLLIIKQQIEDAKTL